MTTAVLPSLKSVIASISWFDIFRNKSLYEYGSPIGVLRNEETNSEGREIPIVKEEEECMRFTFVFCIIDIGD